MADTKLGGARSGRRPAPVPVARAGPPVRRRSARWILLVALLAAAGLVAWQAAAARDDGGRTVYLTEDARVEDLADRVEAAATVAWPRSATADLRAPARGTVTAVKVRAGDRPASLATVFEVDDVPLVVLVSPLPLYRDLGEGTKGSDVKALERALEVAGHDPGRVDTTFDARTKTALCDFQEANDLDPTGVLTRSRALWLPPGGQVTDVHVRRGDTVAPGTVLANVAIPERLVVHADIDQADAARVRSGATVAVTLDALDRPLRGMVERVALLPGEDGTYQATVAVDEPPRTLRAGMEGTARVVVDMREDAVVVPSGAVSGSDGAPTVRLLIDGQPRLRYVELGLVTTEGAEILSGVAPGDAIVVGERD